MRVKELSMTEEKGYKIVQSRKGFGGIWCGGNEPYAVLNKEKRITRHWVGVLHIISRNKTT